MQCTQEVLVDYHRLVVTLVGKFHLVDESLLLIYRVVELRVGVGKLLAVYHQFKTLRESWFRAVHLGKWRHLHGIVGDECGLDISALAELSENLVNEFALAHSVVDVHIELFAHFPNLFLRHAVEVISCLLLDSVENRKTAEWSLETDDLSVDLALWFAVYGDTYRLEQFLGERHHPVVVLILHIELHASKLWVVVAVHTLVAEVLSDFIYTLKSSHDESLEIELCGDTHIHVDVEGIEMSDKGARTCTSGNTLQCRGLHLGISSLVEHTAYGAYYCGTLKECILHSVVDNKVNISLSIAQFGVFKLVVCHSVLVFHDRQWLEALRQ